MILFNEGGKEFINKLINVGFIELVNELMEVTGSSSVYEGMAYPDEFSNLPPEWRAWYLLRAGDDLELAKKLFKESDEDLDYDSLMEFMRQELNPKYVFLRIKEVIKLVVSFCCFSSNTSEIPLLTTVPSAKTLVVSFCCFKP